ncbi:CBU_0592 family membrane protein [Sanguibacter suarezii]|uniref:CBU_0592 family membrane protein n=1 Tax=Sanguibacter suarezii TaxID=60921 RepID=UPI00083628CD|nr:hypothetical protein [Sanguibacter suarezii]
MSTAAELAVTLAGWTGALSTVFAYGMVTAKRITPDSLLFQGLNIVGAGLLAVSASTYGAWPSAVVNVIWVAIGVWALMTLLNQRARLVAAAVVEPALLLGATDTIPVAVFDGAEQDRLSARQAEEFLAQEDAVAPLARNSAHHAPVAV